MTGRRIQREVILFYNPHRDWPRRKPARRAVLKNRILAIPECERKNDQLITVTYSGQAIFGPIDMLLIWPDRVGNNPRLCRTRCSLRGPFPRAL